MPTEKEIKRETIEKCIEIVRERILFYQSKRECYEKMEEGTEALLQIEMGFDSLIEKFKELKL